MIARPDHQTVANDAAHVDRPGMALSRRRLFQTSVVAAATLTGAGALGGTAVADVYSAEPSSAADAEFAPPAAITDGVVLGLARAGNRSVAVGRHTSGRAVAWARTGGSPWRRVTADFGTDATLTAITLYDAGFIAAGSLAGRPAIWTSRSGASWRPVPVSAVAGTLTAVAVSGLGALAVGVRSDGETQEGAGALVVSSADGASWHEVAVQGLPGARVRGLSALAHHDGQWVAASYAVNGAALWTSADGAAWRSATAPGGRTDAGVVVSGLRVVDGELVAVGSTIADTQPRLWRGHAGAWSEVTAVSGEGHGALNDVLTDDAGRAVVVGMRDGRSLTVSSELR